MPLPSALAFPVVAALLLAACDPQDDAPPAAATPAAATANEGLVAHGEYIVRIAGCNDCHTEAYGPRGGDVPKAEWLQGSALGYHCPWGTTYATNLRLTADGLDEAEWLACWQREAVGLVLTPVWEVVARVVWDGSEPVD